METQGLVAPEAMAMGKTVVFTKLGPGPETIVDYETGLLCNPFDPDDIGKKIVWVLSNKEKAKKIGEMGRKFVVDKLDLQKIVNQNYDFFQSIMFEKE
jgi:glycosyltransferase involved in cell wall biosynthesis